MKIKTTMLFIGLLVFGALSTQVFAGSIAGSAHDFSTGNDATWSGGRICIVCHTPHNADTSVTASPLWNHEVTAATFTTYLSDTLDGSVGTVGGTSKLCLSCHDGTVAVDSFGGSTNGSDFLTGSKNLGINLSDDHPISVTYTTATAASDGGLHDPATVNVTIGGDPKSRTGTIGTVLAPGGTVECASCHDVHNTFAAAGNGSLLKVTNTGSALCLTCHDK